MSRLGGGGVVVRLGVGILTFSEKMSQILHPRDNITDEKYQNPPSWAFAIFEKNLEQTILH